MIATIPMAEAISHNTPSKQKATSADVIPHCDCQDYRSRGIACPCSLEYASKTGKRAVERLVHKSVFFNDTNIAANVELQSQAEAAKGCWKTIAANHVVQLSPENIRVGNLLGRGGFCLVFDAELSMKSLQHGGDYCVKFLRPEIIVERRKFARGIADLAIEAHFLATLNHPHILKIRGVTAGIDLFQPVYPKLTAKPGVEGGYFLLLDKMHTTLDKKIDVEWRQRVEKYNSFLFRTAHDLKGIKRKGIKIERMECALQLAQAMQYLHQHMIVYRDLKPDNIGFDKENNLKLFDFGLAKELKPYKRHEDGTYHLTANTGSRRYMAPEVALRKRYNLSVDVYSFAILLWEIFSLEKPFDGYSEQQHMSFVVQRGFRPKIETLRSWPEGMRTLVQRCWDQDMNKRPEFRDIVSAIVEIKKNFVNSD